MRRLKPDEYTDGVHGYTHDSPKKSKAGTGDLSTASWEDYRASLVERFIASNDPTWKLPPLRPTQVPESWPSELPPLSVSRWNHILYGDRRKEKIRGQQKKIWRYQGAHTVGYDWIAGGTPYPADWSENDILDAIQQVLRRGTADGSTKVAFVRGHRIRVVTSKKKGVITAYIDEREEH